MSIVNPDADGHQLPEHLDDSPLESPSLPGSRDHSGGDLVTFAHANGNDSQLVHRSAQPMAMPPALTYPARFGIKSPTQAIRYWEDRRAELQALKKSKRKVTLARRSSIRTPCRSGFSAFKAGGDIGGISADLLRSKGNNTAWDALPDRCPPTSSLDSRNGRLHVKWAEPALDLSYDWACYYLHSQEVNLASTLRLTCASYLTNKRKIFLARLNSLQKGRKFNKAAAQRWCSIDPNKVGQMWEAFERVGWFEDGWFRQWL